MNCTKNMFIPSFEYMEENLLYFLLVCDKIVPMHIEHKNEYEEG